MPGAPASPQLERVLGRLDGVRRNGVGFKARCPAHDDREPSLSVGEGDDGRVLLTCFAGCTFSQIVAQLGLELRDCFPEPAAGAPRRDRLATVDALAAAKGLPAAWLRATWGLHDLAGDQGVGIPYRDEAGRTVAVKVRSALAAKAGSWWPKGQPLLAYGRDRLGDARRHGSLVLAEGESDTWTLWAHEIPALGIPGAQATKTLTADLVQGVSRLLIAQDADAAGETFTARLTETLGRLGWRGELRVVRMPAGIKDVNDWHRRDPVAFPAAWATAVAAAASVGPSPDRARPTLAVTPLDALLAEPEESLDYVVDGLLIAGGTSILAAKPKVGKSTLVRNLALAVARGEPFLGRASRSGPVLYLALEEKRDEVRRHFARMGARSEPILVHVGGAGQEGLAECRALVEAHRPVLAIIDPVLKFVRVQDVNAYAEVSAALEPVTELARRARCHLLLVHHLGKGERTDGDAILGSTALYGAVDAALLYRKREERRTLASVQRYGIDLLETVLVLDPITGRVAAGGELAALERAEVAEKLLAALGEDWLEEAELRERVGGDRMLAGTTLRHLLAEGRVQRGGAGRRGNPYRYARAGVPPLSESSESSERSGRSEQSLFSEVPGGQREARNESKGAPRHGDTA